jgi:hypothetical protein
MGTLTGRLLGSGAVVLRAAIKIAAFAALLLIALGGLALLALETPRGREVACKWILDGVNSAIPGQIRVERCVALPPRSIHLEGIRIDDPSGRTVLRARAIKAEPHLAALLEHTIHIPYGLIEEPSLRLVDHEDQVAIASAFMTNADDEAQDQENDLIVLVDILELTDGSVTDLSKELLLDQIAGRTRLVWADELTLELEHAEARAEQQKKPLLRLSHAEGTLAFGEESRVQVRASLEAQGIESDLELGFRGTMERFSTSLAARTLGGYIEASAKNTAGRIEARLTASSLRLASLLPETRGVAEAEVEASMRFSQPAPALDALKQLTVDGDVSVSGFESPDFQIETISVNAKVEGALPEPQLRAFSRSNAWSRRSKEVAGVTTFWGSCLFQMVGSWERSSPPSSIGLGSG